MSFFKRLQNHAYIYIHIKTGYLIYLRTRNIYELQILRTTLIPSRGFGVVFDTRSALDDTHFIDFSFTVGYGKLCCYNAFVDSLFSILI